MGQAINGINRGEPPSIWDIEFKQPHLFYETEVQQEIPHIASVIVSSCDL